MDRNLILAFALSGTFAAIAGLMFSVKLSGGDANLANGFLLLAIVAVLVGGTPLTGGVGGVLNTASHTYSAVSGGRQDAANQQDEWCAAGVCR